MSTPPIKSLTSIRPVDEFISFVIPVYNEGDGLEPFHRQFLEYLEQEQFSNFEFIYVNDGSRDNSLEVLRSFLGEDQRIKVVNLARNYGKEIALTAGLDIASGDAVIPIDADLQHPFHVISDFVCKWREGYDVVYAVQVERKQGFVRKLLSKLFHRLMAKVSSELTIPKGAGDFRLMSRRAVDKLNQMREKHRVMKGLYCLVGLKQTAVEFKANPRHAGDTKWSFFKLLDLSIDALTSFSTAPLRVATLLGGFSGFASLAFAILTIVKTILFGDPVAGYPTLISVILFLGSAQLLCLGIIGEYLGRIFNETKNRPLYFVEDVYDSTAIGLAEFTEYPQRNAG